MSKIWILNMFAMLFVSIITAFEIGEGRTDTMIFLIDGLIIGANFIAFLFTMIEDVNGGD